MDGTRFRVTLRTVRDGSGTVARGRSSAAFDLGRRRAERREPFGERVQGGGPHHGQHGGHLTFAVRAALPQQDAAPWAETELDLAPARPAGTSFHQSHRLHPVAQPAHRRGARPDRFTERPEIRPLVLFDDEEGTQLRRRDGDGVRGLLAPSPQDLKKLRGVADCLGQLLVRRGPAGKTGHPPTLSPGHRVCQPGTPPTSDRRTLERP